LLCAKLLSESQGDAAWILFGIFGIYLLVLALRKHRGEDIHSAFFSPFRSFWRGLTSWRAVLTSMSTYLVRYFAWSVLQRTAIGLEGYRFKFPLIERRPNNISQDLTRYEDMPIVAEQHALTMRNRWVTRILGDISNTFSSVTLTASDISSLLSKIADDPSLVHAAYYTDDRCIERIADWIAGYS
jgi:hypothetical protein